MSASRSTLKDLQTAIARERDRCAELEREIKEREAELAQRRQALGHLTGTEAYFAAQAAEERESVPKAIRNGMYEIIAAAGRPLYYADILAKLQERGVEVNGKDPLRLVGAHLSNDQRFRKADDRSGYWGLKSWPDAMFAAADRPARGGTVTPFRAPERLRPVAPAVPDDEQTVEDSDEGVLEADPEQMAEFEEFLRASGDDERDSIF